LKILHLIDSGGLYGAEMMLLDLMDSQKHLGLGPILGSMRGDASGTKEIEAEASRRGHRVLSWTLKKGLDVAVARKISEDAVREGFSLLHTHGYKANIHAAAVIRRLARIPWVATLHGWTATRKMSALNFYEILDGVMVWRADRVVSVSPRTSRKWRLVGLPAARHEVIPNGIRCGIRSIPSAETDPEFREFCSKGFVIGSIGRLSPEKNYAMLVEAVAELARGQVDARAVIVGDGEERPRLIRLAQRLGVGDRICLPGYRKDARRYLPFFDVFALTSLTEGLPISLLEAMDAGVPVVAPNVGDVGSVLEQGNSGIIYGKGNLKEFIFYLRNLWRDSGLREKYSVRGPARVKERYTAEAMAAAYHKIYEEVCGRGNGKAGVFFN